MDHSKRGQFVIINNKTFGKETNMQDEERSGTDKDADSLEADFTQFGFNVQRKDNQTVSQMLKLMIDGNVSVSDVNLTG